MVSYLRSCLAYSAGVSPAATTIEEMKSQGPWISKYINNYINGCDDKSPIMVYLGLLRQYVSAIGGGGSMGLYRLLELVASAPDRLAKEFVDSIDELKVGEFSKEK